MNQQLVIYEPPSEEHEYLGFLKLNDPPGNILKMPMLEQLYQQLKGIMKETSNLTSPLRVLIPTHEGENGGYGANMKELVKPKDDEYINVSKKEASHHVDLGLNVVNALEGLPIPTIGAVRGKIYGGSWECFSACDLLYVDTTVEFWYPESQIAAVMPGWKGPRKLFDRVGYSKALRILTSGEKIKHVKAKELGIIEDSFGKEELIPKVKEIASAIAHAGPKAVRNIKYFLRKIPERSEADLEKLARLLTVDTVTSEDCLHGVTQFFKKDESRKYEGK